MRASGDRLSVATWHELTYLWRSRYFEKKSKGVFAVKKMPNLYKLEYANLFQNEARALSLAESYEIPRVIKFTEGARTTDDICLILEYVWLALQKLY